MSKTVPMPRQWEPKPFLRADQPTMVYSSLDPLELVVVHSGGGGREIDGAVAGIRRTGGMERNNRKRGQGKMTTCRKRFLQKSSIFRHAGKSCSFPTPSISNNFIFCFIHWLIGCRSLEFSGM